MQQERHAHHLKTWPEYFIIVKNGHKTFEVRKRDKDFQLTDAVLLQEWDPITKQYTGQEVAARITYILEEFEGLRPGYCAMSIKPVEYYLPGDVVKHQGIEGEKFVILQGPTGSAGERAEAGKTKFYEVQNIESGTRIFFEFENLKIA